MPLHILGAHRIECRYGRYLLEPGECDINLVIEKVNLAHRMAKQEKAVQFCDYDQSFDGSRSSGALAAGRWNHTASQ